MNDFEQKLQFSALIAAAVLGHHYPDAGIALKLGRGIDQNGHEADGVVFGTTDDGIVLSMAVLVHRDTYKPASELEGDKFGPIVQKALDEKNVA